jgi:hypothetical protein
MGVNLVPAPQMLAACSDDDSASPMTALPVRTAGATSEPASTDAATVPETAASTTPEVT